MLRAMSTWVIIKAIGVNESIQAKGESVEKKPQVQAL